jgi:hypothetical protein
LVGFVNAGGEDGEDGEDEEEGGLEEIVVVDNFPVASLSW